MIKHPLKFKLDAYRMYVAHGMTPLNAFETAGKMNNVPLSGCMTIKTYAFGYMSDDIKNYLRRKIIAADLETINYFNQHNLRLDF